MNWKFIATAVVVGLVAFALTPLLWTPSPDVVVNSAQKAGFMLLIFLEALFFGFGCAFVIYGMRPLLHGRRGLVLPFASIAWLVLSWWPHDQFHMANGMNINGLLTIDYTFHLANILAALVLLRFFWKQLEHGSERRDDGIRRGGFEVWK